MRVARRPLPPSTPWIVRTVAETILSQLEQADSQLPLQGLREFASDLRSDLDLRRSELGAAAAIAITQIREPPEVVDAVVTDFAFAEKETPEGLREKVRGVSQDLAVRTRLVVGELKASPANQHRHALEQLAQDMTRRTGDAAWEEPSVQYFVARYGELLGVNILRARLINDLFYAGDAFRGLFERELPIVVIAACAPIHEQAVDTLFAGFYDVIVERGLQASVSHVGRFSASGAQGAAYRAAERVESLERLGVCAPVEKFLTRPVAAVHKAALVGKSPGDERWLLREMAQRGVAIVLGGDDEALDDARAILPSASSRTICCGGFGFDSPNDLTGLTGVGSAFWIPDASTDPSAGQRLGTIVSAIYKGTRPQFWADPLLSVAFREHNEDPKDGIGNLFENSGRNRIVRLVTQAFNRMERLGIPSAQVWCEASHLAQELARRVLSIAYPQGDPDDNALWQQRAKEAFRESGSRVLLDLDTGPDIMYASWVGIRSRRL